LAGYTGILQVDRYAGFNALFKDGRSDKPMTRANCWVHARREFFKLVDIRQQLKRRKKGAAPLVSPLASEALEIIGRLFAIERDINGKPAAERLAVRQERSAPIVAELETWMRETRNKLFRHDAVAKAIAYLQNDWDGFTTFLADGRICLEQRSRASAAQRCSRKKSLVIRRLRSSCQRAAMMFSLFGTARLNDIDPLAWFTDVLAKIADIPQNRLHGLLPWQWKVAQQQLAQEIAA